MAPKTIKKALLDTLEDLTVRDFNKFCYQLLDRREEPRVTRHRVEGKDRQDVVGQQEAEARTKTADKAAATGVTIKSVKAQPTTGGGRAQSLQAAKNILATNRRLGPVDALGSHFV